MILPIVASAEKLDRDLIEAAHDLGAGPLRVFSTVIIPLTRLGNRRRRAARLRPRDRDVRGERHPRRSPSPPHWERDPESVSAGAKLALWRGVGVVFTLIFADVLRRPAAAPTMGPRPGAERHDRDRGARKTFRLCRRGRRRDAPQSNRASSSRSWDPRAAARPPCCGCSPGFERPSAARNPHQRRRA